MTFGWQGFRVEHPDDWAPAQLSGNYGEGYARIASPNRMSLQIRWRSGSDRDLIGALEGYFSKLERDARKRGLPFTKETGEHDGILTYRWTGPEQGRGGIFERNGRIFFVEVYGGKKDALLPRSREALDSFVAQEGDSNLWSVLGLSVLIPSAWTRHSHNFVAGKTSLLLERKLASLECTRWGFAEQLLSQKSFEEWARAALDVPKAACATEADGIRLSGARLGKRIEAIARHQPENNQIVTIKMTQFRGKERPEWDWIS